MQQTDEPYVTCSPILKEKKFSPRILTVLSAGPLHLHSVKWYGNKKQANISIYIGMGTWINDLGLDVDNLEICYQFVHRGKKDWRK